MGNKIKISKDIKDKFSLEKEDEITSISLIINIENNMRVRKYNLNNLLNKDLGINQSKRRKDLSKLASFIINTPRQGSTKCNLISSFITFINKSDELTSGVYLDSQNSVFEALKKYRLFLNKRIQSMDITAESANVFRGQIITILLDCYTYDLKDLNKHFPNFIKRTGKIKNATVLNKSGKEKAYSKNDFKTLLSTLMGISNYCNNVINKKYNCIEIRNNPYIYEKTGFNLCLTFGNNLKLKENILNLSTMCLMMIFIGITGSNLTPAFTARRKDLVIEKGERDFLNLKLTCNRKGKTQYHNLSLKKYQLKFFEKILENSELVDNNENALLFPFIDNNGNFKVFAQDRFTRFYKLLKDNPIINEKGEPIYVQARTLRHTYGTFFEDIDIRSAALFNSVSTAAKHYSSGNSTENNNNLQIAMNIYTVSLNSDGDIEKAKQYKSDIDIKLIDSNEIKKISNDVKLSSNGVLCVNSKNSNMETKFKRILNSKGLNSENISCANILACFHCDNAMLSDSFESVYLLVSLNNYLNNSIYENESSGLFGDRKIVKNALQDISNILKNKIKKETIEKVNAFIEINDFHPLWQTL